MADIEKLDGELLENDAEDTDENGVYLDEDEGIVELEDEDGNVQRFEFIDSIEYNDTTYYALIPESAEDDDEGADQFVVLKETAAENGESVLSTVDDDDEYNEIGELFLNRFNDMAGYEN